MSTSTKLNKRSGRPAAARKTLKAKLAVTTGDDLARPFDPALLRRAREIASSYRLTFEADPDVGYLGSSVELPGVFADGKTIEACARETLEALTTTVATLLETGQRPPSPASEGKREQQVNIRLTADERLRIEEAARVEGFRSVSDYIRAAALRGSA